MSLLGLIFISVLQIEAGVSGEVKYLYSRAGHYVILSCGRASSSDPTCSDVTWLYDKDRAQTFTEVSGGKVKLDSVRAVRLSLDTSCSLIIKNITAEDAAFYTCRQGDYGHHTDTSTYLSVLTISPSPPDADPKRDAEVTLECSLFRHIDLHHCPQISIRWMDETRTVLPGEGEGYKFHGQKNCVSSLTVKRQSGHNRRYTCKVVDEENNVEIEAEYTPVFTGDHQSDHSPDLQTYIIMGAAGGVVVVVVVIIAAVLIKHRKRAKVTVDGQKSAQHPDEPESNLTYATVSHTIQQAPNKKQVKEEEEVTYSTVKTAVQTEADDDPSCLYSYISKPK
ncbi:uncharacterized protein LOC119012952 isoform X3 [Acanthopagrus latus]|uniref:uncharacterized protein LOC119012952 isoform X3 n=1 Tax=Acanthopagrus latus TaxID=8177 RepID=UPI00187C44DA|nr:uncharacterized protein LOC119012952 isoform X3 [Acanthopagrus latus]